MKKLSIYKESLIVLLILFFLTFLTVLVSKLDFGEWHILVSIGIAAIKSTFVLLYFMHLKHEPKRLKISFVVAIFVLAILIGLTLVDTAFRHLTV